MFANLGGGGDGLTVQQVQQPGERLVQGFFATKAEESACVSDCVNDSNSRRSGAIICLAIRSFTPQSFVPFAICRSARETARAKFSEVARATRRSWDGSSRLSTRSAEAADHLGSVGWDGWD